MHASEDLKSDREMVLAAVRQDGNALQCASFDLKSDLEVVMTALKTQTFHLIAYRMTP